MEEQGIGMSPCNLTNKLKQSIFDVIMQRKCGRNSFTYECPQQSIPITRGSLLTFELRGFDYVVERRMISLGGTASKLDVRTLNLRQI